ncbi:hypothetical protein [Streptomyces alanosinicus]|uniref:Uncharacterized protein n=1 Tax=Streptomyces alanosinicus TaxID=68171 RepID=A0A919D011_9ACTN|nr:hypothetical protein [Streptomyces alanosinicus]GHD98874.1 hypothetical protein GCM10010339_07790 [Streptomyces alanosinicus]
MSEALRRIADAVTDVTEGEVDALLSALGLAGRKQQPVREVRRTPLPSPRSAPDIHSEVEWV